MLRYRLVWVGRKAQDPLLEAAEDYRERLSRYASVEVVMLREAGIGAERDAFLAKLQPGERVVACDERGAAWSTMELVDQVRKWSAESPRVTLLVGGADGLHEDVKRAAHQTFSLSRLTLPHRLAQVVLLEQLYRAHTVLRGEKYHRP